MQMYGVLRIFSEAVHMRFLILSYDILSTFKIEGKMQNKFLHNNKNHKISKVLQRITFAA